MLLGWGVMLPLAVMLRRGRMIVRRGNPDRALAVAKNKLDAIRVEDGHPAGRHGGARQEDQAEQCNEQMARREMDRPRAHAVSLPA